jgi:hypothetical protein
LTYIQSGLLPWMVDLAFRNSQGANVTTVVRGGLSEDDSIATLELAIDKVRSFYEHASHDLQSAAATKLPPQSWT